MPSIYDLTDDELNEIADHNAKTFYELKKDLVNTRIGSWSLDEFALLLNESLEDVAGLEQYYSDPTLSQLSRYAAAAKVQIIVRVIGAPDDGETAAEPSGSIEDYNRRSFQSMMDALVKIRKESYTMPELADVLQRPAQELEDLESDDSDPTASQVQEYALAVGTSIDALVASL